MPPSWRSTPARNCSTRWIIAKQIDYLGGMPSVTALPVKQTDDAREMLRVRSRQREPRPCARIARAIAQCEALQEYAIAEDLREILRQEQEHQIDLATAPRRERAEDVKARTLTSRRQRERAGNRPAC